MAPLAQVAQARGTGNADSQRTRILQVVSTATLFACERVTGIEPALSAWEEFFCHRVPLLQRYWRLS